MKNKELIAALNDYMEREHLSRKNLAEIMGVSANTITSWFNGGNISARHQQAIVEISRKYTFSSSCFFDNCPARQPVDRLTQYLLEEWTGMSGEEKGKLIAFIEDMKADKKSITPVVPAAGNL